MPKIITSPVKRWVGTVTIADPLTLPQAEAIEAALDAGLDIDPEVIKKRKGISFLTLDKPRVPAILACVEQWNLENFPDVKSGENFPYSPAKDRHAFVTWLFDEIKNIYFGELEIPNVSSPTLTDTQAKDAAAAN